MSVPSKESGTFKKNIFTVVGAIPRGKTMTYKEVAALAGRPVAYRAVGNILSKNYNQNIPCHRVIRSDGSAGGYNRGKSKKVVLLRRERGELY